MHDVSTSVEGSLDRLGLDYVDLALIHWPIAYEKEGDEYKRKRVPIHEV